MELAIPFPGNCIVVDRDNAKIHDPLSQPTYIIDYVSISANNGRFVITR